MNVRPKLTAAVLSLLVAGLAACLPAAARAVDQPTLTLSASPAAVVAGQPVSLLGTFPGVPGAELTLSRMRAGETEFTPVVSGRLTNAGGNVVWTVRPAVTTTYRVDLTAAGTWTAASAETAVGACAPGSPSLLSRPSRCSRTSTCVTRSRCGRPIPARPCSLLRRTADGWVALKDLTLDGDSQATARVLAAHAGTAAPCARTWPPTWTTSPATACPWKVTVYDKRNPYGTPTRLPHLILVDLLSVQALLPRARPRRARVRLRPRAAVPADAPWATTGSTPRTRT